MSILGKRKAPNPPIALTLVQSYNNPQHFREIYHPRRPCHRLSCSIYLLDVAMAVLKKKGTCTEDRSTTPIDVTFHALSNNGQRTRYFHKAIWPEIGGQCLLLTTRGRIKTMNKQSLDTSTWSTTPDNNKETSRRSSGQTPCFKDTACSLAQNIDE